MRRSITKSRHGKLTVYTHDSQIHDALNVIANFTHSVTNDCALLVNRSSVNRFCVCVLPHVLHGVDNGVGLAAGEKYSVKGKKKPHFFLKTQAAHRKSPASSSDVNLAKSDFFLAA